MTDRRTNTNKRKYTKKTVVTGGLLLSLCLLTGCAGGSSTAFTASSSGVTETSQAERSVVSSQQTTDEELPKATRDIFAMDTIMDLTAYGEEAEAAVDAAVDEINRLDTLFSVGNEDGDIAQLNTKKTATVSDETYALIKRSLELYKSTDGALNITVYPLMDAWGFTTSEYRVPEKDELQKLLKTMKIEEIQCDSETKTITLPEDTSIDLGAIAKGYTSSRLMDIFAEYDVASAMVSLGGNVQVYRAKPDGSKWRVAVEDPFSDSESDYIGVLSLEDQAAITSGAYERYFEQDGVRYHHIIDPSTGYPAESGLSSVTIVSADGTLADALSTSLFIMGKDKALAYWRAHADEFDVVLIEDNGTITVSEGLKDTFSSEQAYEIAEREEN